MNLLRIVIGVETWVKYINCEMKRKSMNGDTHDPKNQVNVVKLCQPERSWENIPVCIHGLVEIMNFK